MKKIHEAETKALYQKVKDLTDERDTVLKQLDKMGTVSKDDVNEAESLERAVSKLEAGLHGMNLSARVKRLGDADIQVRSSASGQPIQLDGELLDITEATEIVVPDVVEIQLAPKGVDVDAIGKELQDKESRLQVILDTCGAVRTEPSASPFMNRIMLSTSLSSRMNSFPLLRTSSNNSETS